FTLFIVCLPLIIISPPQSMDSAPASSIGRKSYIADRQRWSYPRRGRLERKNYEATKPQTTLLQDRHRWSRIPLVGQRIRAASRVAGHDDDFRHGAGSQAT